MWLIFCGAYDNESGSGVSEMAQEATAIIKDGTEENLIFFKCLFGGWEAFGFSPRLLSDAKRQKGIKSVIKYSKRYFHT